MMKKVITPKNIPTKRQVITFFNRVASGSDKPTTAIIKASAVPIPITIYNSTLLTIYISSIKKNNAKYFGRYIRNHWGIENRLHWVKDVIMKEDTSKTAGRMAAENISILRNIAINLFRLDGFDSIKHATQLYANNFKELWRLISYKPINKKMT